MGIVNLSAASYDPAFGAGPGGDIGVKARIMNLIASVRTVMRGVYPPSPSFLPIHGCTTRSQADTSQSTPHSSEPRHHIIRAHPRVTAPRPNSETKRNELRLPRRPPYPPEVLVSIEGGGGGGGGGGEEEHKGRGRSRRRYMHAQGGVDDDVN